MARTKQTKRNKGKANYGEGAKPEAANPAAAPLQASTSNSTPASIKKKIKKKEKMVNMKREISETDITVAKEAKAEAPGKAKKSFGFIFMCNSRTKPECYRHQVFGLPRGKAELVERIKPGAQLFLYDFDLKLLYGIYRAASAGRINLDSEAFGGAFPAQVKFKIEKDCIPLPERSFKQAILKNYDANNRFEPNLSAKQVHRLVLLFQTVSKAPPQTTPLQYTENKHPPAHLPPPADPYRYLPPLRMPPPEDPYRSGGHLASVHMPPPEDQYRSAGQVAASHLPLPEDPYRSGGHLAYAHMPPPEDQYRSAGQVAASHLPPPEDPYRSGGHLASAHMPPPEDQYRSAGQVAASHLPPPEDPYRSGGHLAFAHMPPPEDQYRSAGQVSASHLPPPEDPYKTAGHMVHPHPLPEDPYRSVGDVVASYLHPAVAYRSGRYLMHHQLPPEDPYRHAYLPRAPIDSRYLSPFAPPPANDPHASQHLLAVPTAPPPTDPYYPAPASNPYGQLEVGRAYYPENPALSNRFAYRRAPEASVAEAYRSAPATLAATEPTLQQRYYTQSSEDANHSAYIQRQATNTAPTVSVSSLYAFAGVAPAHR